MSEAVAILLLAVVLDLVFTEPPPALHLTVWMGRAIAALEKPGLAMKRPAAQFTYGLAISLLLLVLFGGASFFLLRFLSGLNAALYIVVAALLLKPTFCIRWSGLLSLLVRDYLKQPEPTVEKADKRIRFLLSTVERRPGEDYIPAVASSTIRSLAENASDFLVAPLFYFVLLGVPGAVAYRVANTLDGMLGHHGVYEYLGKFAARFDDVLNFIPARITAVLFILAALLPGFNAGQAWHAAAYDHVRTESPNAGWPMAAAAGALEVRLGRADMYALGDPIRPLDADTIGRAVSLFGVMSALAVAASALILIYL